MRYGIITLTWSSPFTGEQLDLFPRIADAGYDDVEVFVEDPAGLEVRAVASALEGAGLIATVCPQLHSERDPSAEDDGVRQAGVDYLKQCVDLASAWGGRIVGGPLYGDQVFYGGAPSRLRSEYEREALWERALRSLGEVADHASAHGVRLAVEPLNRFETSLLCLAEHAVRFVDELDHPAVGILLDTYHMNIEESDIGAAIRAAGDRLIHFHANENHRGAPGTGLVDWDEVAAALRDVGFDDMVVTEPFRRTTAPGESLALWRPPLDAHKEDQVAIDALEFLRRRLG